MPTNKNALRRIKILDELLSNPIRRYSRQDLYEIVKKRLYEYDGEVSLSKRTIEKDLVDLQMSPFNMEIVEEPYNGKVCVRYCDQSQSIFSKPLSDEEKVLLRETLNTLGQFSGLDHFEWLEALQNRLNNPDSLGGFSEGFPKEKEKIISFSKNPYLNNQVDIRDVPNFLQILFHSIANKICVTVEYRKFSGEESTFILYPYLLKQYNDRWYLICGLYNADEDFIMNLPLDRMKSVLPLPQIAYRACTVDLEERFSKIIGVTYRTDVEEQVIVFAVSSEKVQYVRTKPIHETQKEYVAEKQSELRARYPSLEDYIFFEIECIPNNELMECLFSYDKQIVLISPSSIRGLLTDELKRQMQVYESLIIQLQ